MHGGLALLTLCWCQVPTVLTEPRLPPYCHQLPTVAVHYLPRLSKLPPPAEKGKGEGIGRMIITILVDCRKFNVLATSKVISDL